jgi:hypothetical protein
VAHVRNGSRVVSHSSRFDCSAERLVADAVANGYRPVTELRGWRGKIPETYECLNRSDAATEAPAGYATGGCLRDLGQGWPGCNQGRKQAMSYWEMATPLPLANDGVPGFPA